MKAKNAMRLWIFMASVLLFTLAGNAAYAITVEVKNATSETVNVMIYTRSDYSWDKFPTAFSSAQPVNPAGSYTFNIPTDSRHMCPSYLAGYNSNYSTAIVMMGCNGVEADCPSTRCCENSTFEVYKSSDGKLHFRKK